jgi:soluble lytic murein transglycosylase
MTDFMIFNMPRRFSRLLASRYRTFSHLVLVWLTLLPVCLSSILCITAFSQAKADHFNSLLIAILEAKDELKPEQFNDALQKLLAKDNLPDSQRKETSYVLARCLQKSTKKEEKKQALALFDQAQSLPALRVLSKWHIVELATTLGQEKLVRHTLEQLLNESKEEKAKVQYSLAQSYLRTNTLDRAVPLFKAIHDHAKTTNYALGSAYYLGEIALSQAEAQGNLIKDSSNYKEGLSLFCSYLQLSPTGHFAPIIIDRLTRLANKLESPPSFLFDTLAYAHYSNGHWRQALDLWLKSKTDNNRKLEIATCLAKLGSISQAESSLLRFIEIKPTDQRYIPVANMICAKFSKTEAINLWQRILAAKPKASDAALWNIAIRSKPPISLQSYKDLLNRYPNSSYAAESQWALFWHSCQHKRRDESQQLVELAENSAQKYAHAKSAPRFLFWAAKLSEKMGKEKQAEYYYNKTAGLFPADYYGFRSLENLFFHTKKSHIYIWDGSAHNSRSTRWIWPLPLDLKTRTNKVEEEPLWELVRLRQYDEALSFTQANQTELKAWIYARLNSPSQTIALASGALQGKPSSATLWQYAFPLLYNQEIDCSSRAAGNVDSNLMRALVREESAYDPKAISPAGAIGLTQLLPSTALSTATKLHIKFNNPNQLFEPSLNLELGTQYVSSLLSLLQNNALSAVASYNSGSGPVSSLLAKLRASGTDDLDIFVEEIPFAETRDYVRNVFRSYWIYNSIY